MGLRPTRYPKCERKGIIVEDEIRCAFERLCRGSRTLENGLRKCILLVCGVENIDMETEIDDVSG